MDKVNLHTFYRFGGGLSEIDKLDASRSPTLIILTLLEKIGWLNLLLRETANISMPLTRGAAQKLYQKIIANERVTPVGINSDWTAGDEPIERDYLEKVKKVKAEFDTVFSHESQSLDVFSISSKGAYSTTTLIERGENILPESIRTKISSFTRDELHEATKCIAFNLPTASGFHLVRALESAVRDYHAVVSGGAPGPVMKTGKQAPMGEYINALEKLNVNADLIATLRQIKVLHREPQMHPEAVLNMDEAIILLGIITSAIWAMFR